LLIISSEPEAHVTAGPTVRKILYLRAYGEGDHQQQEQVLGLLGLA
jgi:hypothetical protein